MTSASLGETPAPSVPVVRTLKPPPEIWELVRPVQLKQVTGVRAFVGRLVSSQSIVVVLAAAIVSVGVYIGLRSGQKIAGVKNSQVSPTTQVDSKKRGVAVSTTPAVENSTPAAPVDVPVNQATVTAGSDELAPTPSRRSSKPNVTRVRNEPTITETATATKPDSSASTQVSPAAESKTASQSTPNATGETVKARSDEAPSGNRTKSILSPQLIDSPKTTTPRKPKVIQWP